MSWRVMLAAVLALVISVVVVLKLMGTGPNPVTANPNLIEKAVQDKTPLPIAKGGPQPKVSVSEVEFHFGRMQVGQERSHDFIFTNLGEAPLTIQMGKTTCQCTYGDMKEGEARRILPGQSQTVTLTWKPEFATDEFSKGADIWTDDPDQAQQKISLRAVGIVGARFIVRPEKEWPCPDLVDDKPVVCTGVLGSGVLKDFNITAVESRGTPLEFEVEPLKGEDLKANQSGFGFRVKLTVKPDMQMGVFAFPVTIKTDVPEEGEKAAPGKMTEFEVLISGVRRGPIRLAGPDWIEAKMGIGLGSFEAAVGKNILVPLFVRNPPEEGLQLTKPPEVTPPDLKVEIVRDKKSAGKAARLFLKVEYPAGAPRVSFRNLEPGTIKLFTNHPHAPELELHVYFAAY